MDGSYSFCFPSCGEEFPGETRFLFLGPDALFRRFVKRGLTPVLTVFGGQRRLNSEVFCSAQPLCLCCGRDER